MTIQDNASFLQIGILLALVLPLKHTEEKDWAAQCPVILLNLASVLRSS